MDDPERFQRAFDLYQRARGSMAAGAVVDAVEALQASTVLEPHFKTLELLGECLSRLGRLREAVVPLAAATMLNRQVRAPALLADVFLQLGEPERAVEFADLALGRDPANRLAGRVRAAAVERLEPEA